MIGKDFMNGKGLGGMGFFNLMKIIFGIEKFKLKVEKVDSGYFVIGILFWVLNLGDSYYFVVVFVVFGDMLRMVMVIVECFGEGVKIIVNDEFVVMDGICIFVI